MTLDLGPWTLDSYAAFSSSDKGTASAGFLKLAAGARAAALGEAFTAMANDATALYWNPAALTRLSRKSATFMHALHLDSSFFDYVAYGQQLGKGRSDSMVGPAAKSQAPRAYKNLGYIGFALQYFSAGSITQTDETGTQTGAFTPSDLAFTVGYARKFRAHSYGLNLKFIQSTIEDTAQTFALDLGILSPTYFSGRYRYGLSVTNLGGSLKYGDESESLPLAIRFGNVIRHSSTWSTSLDLSMPVDNAPYVALGTEYQISLGQSWFLTPRAGYNTRSSSDLSGLSGASFGFGTGTSFYGFDYAFVPFGNLGIAHRLSLSVGF